LKFVAELQADDLCRIENIDNYSSKVAAVDKSAVVVETAVAAELAELPVAETVVFAADQVEQLEIHQFSKNAVGVEQNSRFDCYSKAVAGRISFRKICRNWHRFHFFVRNCGKSYLLSNVKSYTKVYEKRTFSPDFIAE
jgi:hypothetical protein